MEPVVGQEFHNLTVVSVPAPCRWNMPVPCRCTCGKQKAVSWYNLRRGVTKSCGCWRAESARRQFTRHGASKGGRLTPEYAVYWGMLRRCYEPHRKDYPNYGGRGIAVCDRWRKSYENFLADMGTRPSAAHSLDRMDHNGPYAPYNCRWATRLQQNNNTRSNTRITYQGRTQTLAEWSREVGIKTHTIGRRLAVGWSVADALTLPPDSTRRVIV